jgi:hypothetical protein
MVRSNYLTTFATAMIATSASLLVFSNEAGATNRVEVSCDRQQAVPRVIATLSDRGTSQTAHILSFLPQYFSPEDAESFCQDTASKLNVFYNQERMNYLASDTVNRQPVVCAVERRGLGCDSYNSEVLFSLAKPVNPTELLYNMLGENFKSSQIPSSRTVSRIYTDLRPQWWPF